MFPVVLADDFLALACESLSSIIDKRENRFRKCFKTASGIRELSFEWFAF
jgi:hypothetical protein